MQTPNDRKTSKKGHRLSPKGSMRAIRNSPLTRIYVVAGVYDRLYEARLGLPRFYPHSVHLFENGNSAIFLDLYADRHTTTAVQHKKLLDL